MLSKVRPWMAIATGTSWAALTLYLLWLCTNAAVFIGDYSFLRLMAGPGYLVAEQLKTLPPNNGRRVSSRCKHAFSTR